MIIFVALCIYQVLFLLKIEKGSGVERLSGFELLRSYFNEFMSWNE